MAKKIKKNIKKAVSKSKTTKTVKPAKKILKTAKKSAKPKVAPKVKKAMPKKNQKVAKEVKQASKVVAKELSLKDKNLKVKEESKLKKANQDIKLKKQKDEKVDPAPAKESPKIELKEVFLTDAEGRRLCKVTECDQPSMVELYCRYHYLLFWKKIQIRRKILSEGKLEKYIEELTSRYPLKYLDLLKKDLSSEAEFMAAISELEIDENINEGDGEFEDDQQNYIEEVSGIPDRDTSSDSDQDSF